MTLAEFRRRCAGRVVLVRVANASVTVRTSMREVVRLFRRVHGRVEIDVRCERYALIRVPRSWPS